MVLVVAVLAATLVVAGAGALAVVAADRSSRQTVPSGAFLGGVDVGGLQFDTAVARVRAKVEAPLHRPVKLTVDGFSVDTSPWDLGYRVDVPAVVHRAMAASDDRTVLSRVSSQLFSSGGAPFLDVKPAWVAGGSLDRVLADAAKAVATAPKDADIDVSSGWVTFTPEKAGRVVDVEASRRAVMDGIAMGDDVVHLVTSATTAQADPTLSKVILVRAGENKLYLYDNGRIVKSWPVATGASGYLTPPGVWRVVEKDLNPSWYNPGSAWARGLPKVIGPGPSNPLGTKALALDAPGILIHATSNTGSIGYSESHGCIRMSEADEAELFSMVPVGTRVAVAQVTAPRPKGSAPIVQTAF